MEKLETSNDSPPWGRDNVFVNNTTQGNKMGYIHVQFKEYISTTDTFLFECHEDYPHTTPTQVSLSGSQIQAIKTEYDNTSDRMGCGMSNRDVAIACILHDQDELKTDDPSEFVGRGFEIDN